MATIICLSGEVISIILANVNINIKDVVSFASTCKHFQGMINDDNILWQKKFYQRWPDMKRVYDKQKYKELVNFEKEIKASIKCRKELWCYVMQMSEMHYYKDDLSNSDMKDFDSLFHPDKGAHDMNYYFLIDEIKSFFAQFSWDSNLTHRYYIKKLLRYIQQCRLKSTWQKFVNYPEKQQLLEQAATIVAQWYQPRKHVSYSHIKASLANIAQQVLECLKKEHPTHSIFSTSAELFSFWEHNNIDDNQWDNIEGKQIIDILRKVLFDKIGFSGTWLFENPEMISQKHTLIDFVLEKKIGNTVSLAIIFQSVARRLGIRCDLISFPSHFFLSWKSSYNTTHPEAEDYFYIDVLHCGSILSRNDCPRIRGAKMCPIKNFNAHSKISPTEVILRMINYLQRVNHNKRTKTRSLLELQHLVEPDNIDTIAQLGRYYIQHHMDLLDLTAKLTEIQNNCKNIKCAEVRRTEMLLDKFMEYTERPTCNKTIIQRKMQRTKEMMFRIGMIVTCHDKVTSRSLTGVIIGWDEEFNSHVEMEWKQCRPLYNCPVPGSNTLSQPFYKVFCEEDKAYYVVEDAIAKKSLAGRIKHKEIGRYFCKFEENCYVPNEMLAKHYPCDL
ncbi:F-box only protein 21 [Anoplolepis gracilipes]|uniref:F-box only protein 21 n=1 Tax=Anoplolepis gracilipes TaxID=354296 RepID=UPI003BA36EC1